MRTDYENLEKCRSQTNVTAERQKKCYYDFRLGYYYISRLVFSSLDPPSLPNQRSALAEPLSNRWFVISLRAPATVEAIRASARKRVKEFTPSSGLVEFSSVVRAHPIKRNETVELARARGRVKCVSILFFRAPMESKWQSSRATLFMSQREANDCESACELARTFATINAFKQARRAKETNGRFSSRFFQIWIRISISGDVRRKQCDAIRRDGSRFDKTILEQVLAGLVDAGRPSDEHS